MEKNWLLKRSTINIKELSRSCGITESVAAVLVNRGIKEKQEINKFLNASLEDLYDPFLMKHMDKAVEIILKAIKNGDSIAVYGDYDADGVTSTTILYKALRNSGANVMYHIPDRESEGYGMSSERIKILKEQGVQLIVSCDNGISALEQVDFAKELGLRVIITDHHELPFNINAKGERQYVIPRADAVVNPKQLDCKYPFKQLCGAGIAFKLVQALFEKLEYPKAAAYDYLEFAGIGTVCDIVDLLDENRILVKNALKRINTTENLGLKALKNLIGIEDKAISTYNIGFQIGPCINATGRLDKAALSVELLLAEDEEMAKELAKKLVELNKERQDLTTSNVEQVIDKIEEEKAIEQKVLVIYKEDLHESIAGIVAGKVKERYNLPTIMLTKGKDMPKGSGRSIEEYNMFEELLKCKELLSKFGGHPMAAGLSIKEENIKSLRDKLNENCTLTEEDFKPKIRIEKRIPLRTVDFDFIASMETLEPFGKGNPSPLFAEKDIRVRNVSYLGKDGSTVKFLLDKGDGVNTIEALCFGRSEDFKALLNNNLGKNLGDLRLDLIFTPQINSYMGKQSLQLRVADFRISNLNIV